MIDAEKANYPVTWMCRLTTRPQLPLHDQQPEELSKILDTAQNRWLEVLWHCLTNHVPYDEATHAANRNRALALAA